MTQSNGLPGAQRTYWVGAIAAVLLSVLPVILWGFLPGRDFASHTVWLKEFHKQLMAGEWFPRWLLDANDGLGTPAFFFYGPLSFYISSALIFLTGGVLSIPRILGFSCALAGFLSFVFAYCWLRRWVPSRAALVGGAFYAAAPYHVFVDLYNRAAFGEYWAFVWLPLIFWATDRLFDRRPAAVSLLAVTYSLLAFAHLPTMVLIGPFLLAYVLWRGWSDVRAAALGCAAMVLGAALAAIFLIPAYLEQRHVAFEVLSSGYFDYRNWFMFRSWLHPVREMPDRWSWIALSTVVAAIAWFSIHRKGARGETGVPLFFLFSIAGICFMMSPLSAWIWALLAPLQAVQFPSRWNTDLVLACSALVAFGVAAVGDHNRPATRFAAASTAICIICFSYLGVAVWLVQKRDVIQGAGEYEKTWGRFVRHRVDYTFTPIYASAFHGGMDPEHVARAVDSALNGQQVVMHREVAGPYRLRFSVRGGAGRSIELPVFTIRIGSP